jgi:hypothetical protein
MPALTNRAQMDLDLKGVLDAQLHLHLIEAPPASTAKPKSDYFMLSDCHSSAFYWTIPCAFGFNHAALSL